MRQVLTISLPENLNKEMNQYMKEEKITRSDLVREAIFDYIYFKKLKHLRDKMIIKSQKSGIYTDEDVFELIS